MKSSGGKSRGSFACLCTYLSQGTHRFLWFYTGFLTMAPTAFADIGASFLLLSFFVRLTIMLMKTGGV